MVIQPIRGAERPEPGDRAERKVSEGGETSSDGCAVSIDGYGKTVRQAAEETAENYERLGNVSPYKKQNRGGKEKYLLYR